MMAVKYDLPAARERCVGIRSGCQASLVQSKIDWTAPTRREPRV